MMPESLTMETLASGIKKQGIELRKQGNLLSQHIADCGVGQQVLMRTQEATAAKLETLTTAVGDLQTAFEPFVQVATIASILLRWGKVIVVTIVTAFIGSITTILVQNYMLHQATAQRATEAAQAAVTVSQTQGKILKKVTELVPGP